MHWTFYIINVTLYTLCTTQCILQCTLYNIESILLPLYTYYTLYITLFILQASILHTACWSVIMKQWSSLINKMTSSLVAALVGNQTAWTTASADCLSRRKEKRVVQRNVLNWAMVWLILGMNLRFEYQLYCIPAIPNSRFSILSWLWLTWQAS